MAPDEEELKVHETIIPPTAQGKLLADLGASGALGGAADAAEERRPGCTVGLGVTRPRPGASGGRRRAVDAASQLGTQPSELCLTGDAPRPLVRCRQAVFPSSGGDTTTDTE